MTGKQSKQERKRIMVRANEWYDEIVFQKLIQPSVHLKMERNLTSTESATKVPDTARFTETRRSVQQGAKNE